MDKHVLLEKFVIQHAGRVGKVVDYDPEVDHLFRFDFTSSNSELNPEDIIDTDKFSAWVNQKLKNNKCRYGIGGYMEHRTLYARSELFNSDDEPRRLHLGVDIWADAGTPVYVPLDGRIHSFRDNNHFGDYGPTVILQHDLDGLRLYTLYGHLNRECLQTLKGGEIVVRGQRLGLFGSQQVNGHWPPHLHFQLMFDIQGCNGDYPGVGRYSEKENLVKNIPDPNLLLQFRIRN